MLYLETDGRWSGAKYWHHATCSLHLLVPLLGCPLLAFPLCAPRVPVLLASASWPVLCDRASGSIYVWGRTRNFPPKRNPS